MMLSDELVCVGKVGKSIGLKGEAKFHIHTDFIQSLQKGSQLVDERLALYTIAYFNPHKPSIIFDRISSIEAIKPLVNKALYQSIKQTKKSCALAQGEYFWFDIIGCQIEEHSTILGKVVDIERIGSIDYLIIKTTASLVAHKTAKTFLVPYQDRYIDRVDMDKKLIVVQHAQDILEHS